MQRQGLVYKSLPSGEQGNQQIKCCGKYDSGENKLNGHKGRKVSSRARAENQGKLCREADASTGPFGSSWAGGNTMTSVHL